jgi:hypothetical protein
LRIALAATILLFPLSGAGAVSYSDLRRLPGTAGQTVTVTAPDIVGAFSFVADDPNGYGDDGGVVIRAPNGWWLRNFAHTQTDPVRLDWYQLGDGQDVTEILMILARAYKRKLYVKVPERPMILRLRPIDFGALGIRYFALLESSSQVELRQVGSGSDLFRFADMRQLIIGTAVQKGSRDDYNLTLVGTWAWNHRAGTEGGALVKIDAQNGKAPPFHLRFNTRNSLHASIRMYGNGGPAVTHVSGRFEGGGMTFGHRQGEIRFEDAYVADPVGYAHGWKGTTEGSVDKSLSNVRVLGVTTVLSKKVTGSLELRYGGAHFGSFFVDEFGNGPDDPFVIVTRDYGYTGPNDAGRAVGVRLQRPWFMTFAVKFDGMGIEQPGKRHIKLVQEDTAGPANSPRRVFLEAAQCDDVANCSATANSFTTWTLVNIDGDMDTNGVGAHPQDRSHHMVYQGDGVHPAQIAGTLTLHHHDTARDGQFHSIVIQSWPHSHPGQSDGSHNAIVSVRLTGTISVNFAKRPADNNRVENVTWLGEPREVMRVAAGASVSAANLCAPAGSSIGGAGSVRIGGRSVQLPYELQSSDCEKSQPALSQPR